MNADDVTRVLSRNGYIFNGTAWVNRYGDSYTLGPRSVEHYDPKTGVYETYPYGRELRFHIARYAVR